MLSGALGAPSAGAVEAPSAGALGAPSAGALDVPSPGAGAAGAVPEGSVVLGATVPPFVAPWSDGTAGMASVAGAAG